MAPLSDYVSAQGEFSPRSIGPYNGYLNNLGKEGIVKVERAGEKNRLIPADGYTIEQVVQGADGQGPLAEYSASDELPPGFQKLESAQGNSIDGVVEQPYTPNKGKKLDVYKIADSMAYFHPKVHRAVLQLARTNAELLSKKITTDGLKGQMGYSADLVSYIMQTPDIYDPIKKEMEMSGIDINGMTPLQASQAISEIFAAYVNFPKRMEEAIRRENDVAKQIDNVEYTKAMVLAAGGKEGLKAYERGVVLLDAMNSINHDYRKMRTEKKKGEISDAVENTLSVGGRVAAVGVTAIPKTFFEVLGYIANGLKEAATSYPLPTAGAAGGIAEWCWLLYNNSPIVENFFGPEVTVLEEIEGGAASAAAFGIAVPLVYGIFKGMAQNAKEKKVEREEQQEKAPANKQKGRARSRI